MLSALGDRCRTHGPIPLLPRSLGDRRQILRITGSKARRIIHGRPYRDKMELVTKGILPDFSYAKIQDQIAVR
jgi:hypothetical protein